MSKISEKMEITWDEIESKFYEVSRMSCKPTDIKKVRGDYIFDEEKSVKWNREQIELNNQEYQKEVARLNSAKNKFRDYVNNLIIEKTQNEIGYNISYEKAKAIWDFTYNHYKELGFYEIRTELFDLIELVIVLLKK